MWLLSLWDMSRTSLHVTALIMGHALDQPTCDCSHYVTCPGLTYLWLLSSWYMPWTSLHVTALIMAHALDQPTCDCSHYGTCPGLTYLWLLSLWHMSRTSLHVTALIMAHALDQPTCDCSHYDTCPGWPTVDYSDCGTYPRLAHLWLLSLWRMSWTSLPVTALLMIHVLD